MPAAFTPVSKSTSSVPVFTTVGVKKFCDLSAGTKAAAETSANSSGVALSPKVSCGFSIGPVPARSVVTANAPSRKR